MDLEMARTIAAFGGLGLGIINLGILAHKEYFRKPTFRASLHGANIRAIEDGTYDIQLNLELSSRGGNVYLKEIYFIHQTPIFNPGKGINKRTVYKAVSYPGYCSLNSGAEHFISKAKELYKNSFNIVNAKLENKESKLVSVIDRICTERYMDGFWEWPENNWTLEIVTSANSVTIAFCFEVHESNKSNSFTHS
ncbi:hypothetical protein Noc_2070 [Nitrosococcus oceani ATCC 19707]|uniref:Uncharacterized protein n=2 Tax=Nitrosococcus oceani TaxID=1229 RepID=Q3J9G6_NITOC|nr:hypothetical protein [Nitrosococcus oceani]ABA58530.1 hypothetical protein Noc_2070 [Nitrosococcus oceani ATCC 19707]EDZ67943.1 hypothetical protein NOC27_1270 [Nitrosococcus oceani AFC27]KFI19013.1 hypothetical protein IB75_11030 [Nitrosococcus oceani C-27]GEM19650.1 hypothetical protein NONS58_10440 [Nitrosococcus oceani]